MSRYRWQGAAGCIHRPAYHSGRSFRTQKGGDGTVGSHSSPGNAANYFVNTLKEILVFLAHQLLSGYLLFFFRPFPVRGFPVDRLVVPGYAETDVIYFLSLAQVNRFIFGLDGQERIG